MDKKDYSPLFDYWKDLSPEEFIEELFAKTDMNGVMDMAVWHVVERSHSIPGVERYHMNWTMAKKDRIIRNYCTLRDALVKIAPYYDKRATTAPAAIKDTHLLEIWKKYLQPLDGGDADLQNIKDIQDRIGTRHCVQSLAAVLAEGKELDAKEKNLLIEYMDVEVSAEEKSCLERYEANQRKDAQNRLGGTYRAEDLVNQARRVCWYMARKAPEDVLLWELRYLAYCMVMNGACESMECLRNTQRLWDQMLALESDDEEELDFAENERKTNSVKYLLPVYVLKVLKEKTNSFNHMRQKTLLEELKQCDVYVERKALNRAVHTLAADPNLPVQQDNKSGVWYEQ